MKFLVTGHDSRPNRFSGAGKIEYYGTSHADAKEAQANSKSAFTALHSISGSGRIKQRVETKAAPVKKAAAKKQPTETPAAE